MCSMCNSPIWPFQCQVSKVCQVKDLVNIDTDSDHVAPDEENHHRDEQHGNLLVPPLAAGHPAISIG